MHLVLSKQQEKSQRARDAICEAAIESLYKVGYADTTLIRVAEMAGFSKGALQHHFPTKEDLITATADRLLERSVPIPRKRKGELTVAAALLYSWKKMVNTPQYRALLEVLNATRTDKKLQDRLSEKLIAWGLAMDEHAVKTYKSINGTDEDVEALMKMTRSFMRGLVIQERYIENPDENYQHVLRWIEIISSQIEIRNP